MTDSDVCRIEAVHVSDHGVLVDAQHLTRPSVAYRNTPLLADFSGIMAVPQVGQKVVVAKDSTGFEYVEGVLTGPDDPAPSLKENEFVLQFDPSTKVTATKRDDGGYDLSIEASGDVSVDAGGNILLGQNGEKVAKQSHSHDYDDTGDTGDGTAGTTTKTTTTPNESGTNTKIE